MDCGVPRMSVMASISVQKFFDELILLWGVSLEPVRSFIRSPAVKTVNNNNLKEVDSHFKACGRLWPLLCECPQEQSRRCLQYDRRNECRNKCHLMGFYLSVRKKVWIDFIHKMICYILCDGRSWNSTGKHDGHRQLKPLNVLWQSSTDLICVQPSSMCRRCCLRRFPRRDEPTQNPFAEVLPRDQNESHNGALCSQMKNLIRVSWEHVSST